MPTTADLAAATGPVTGEITPGFACLASLEPEWRRLFALSNGQPSLSYEWTQALVRTQVAPEEPCYVVQLRRGGVLVGIVPLTIRVTRVFGGRPHFIARPLSEAKDTHSDLLLIDRDRETIDAFFACLRQLPSRWDSFRLSKLLETDGLTQLLEEGSARARFTPRRRFRKAAYWISLPGTFAEYFAARSQKFRNHARRAEKKLRKGGCLDEIEVTTPETFERGFDMLLHVERQSWKEAHGTSISAVAKETALYREWGRALAASGQLHLQLLTLDGEPIAHNIGCIHRGIYYYVKTSYAAAHRPARPATFLRLSLIERLIARGVREVDFCGTPYEWEQQWAATYRWHHVLSIYADTWRGRVLSRLDRWTHYSTSGQTIEHADPRSQRAPTS